MKRFGYIFDKLVQPAVPEEFIKGLEDNKLLYTQCKKCNAKYLPPRQFCQCGATEMDWNPAPLEGATLYTFCFYGEMGMPPEAMQKRLPYMVGVAELSDGQRILGHLAGIRKPKIGMPLKIVPNQDLDDGEGIVFKFVKG
ncbi:MAG: Zn-ribbon domain-containing OB-fold protein [Candidatus Hodarchaeota archaeon]